MLAPPLFIPSLSGERHLNYLATSCDAFGFFCLAIFLTVMIITPFVSRKLRDLSLEKEINSKRSESLQNPNELEHNTFGVSHLAVILDGNRRYAKKKNNIFDGNKISSLCQCILQNLSKNSSVDTTTEVSKSISILKKLVFQTQLDGHRVGAENLENFISYVMEAKISVLTLYAFSIENWKRDSIETSVLMIIFIDVLLNIEKRAEKNGIFVRFVSTDVSLLPPPVLQLMKMTENRTRTITPRNLILNVCLSYSGQQEIANACTAVLLSRSLSQCQSPVKADELRKFMLRSITQSNFEVVDENIFLENSIEPQLVIRTGGEYRLSNFLLFECAYSEFFFTSKKWPEFSKNDLLSALHHYSQREKRCGK